MVFDYHFNYSYIHTPAHIICTYISFRRKFSVNTDQLVDQIFLNILHLAMSGHVSVSS